MTAAEKGKNESLWKQPLEPKMKKKRAYVAKSTHKAPFAVREKNDTTEMISC